MSMRRMPSRSSTIKTLVTRHLNGKLPLHSLRRSLNKHCRSIGPNSATFFKWGQEFPRVSHVFVTAGDASGNESEDTTIPFEDDPGIVKSKCAGTALVRPTSETILASNENRDKPGHTNICVLTWTCVWVRQGCRF